MTEQPMTRRDAAILDLDDEGLDAETIAIVLGCEAAAVDAALLRHADRRRDGWRDAA